MTEGTIETIGCDLGDKQAEIFILRADGTSDRARPVKLTRAAAAAGEQRQLHPRSVWERQRLEAMGTGAGQTRWEERPDASEGRGGPETRGTDAPPVGDGRGIPG